MAAASTVPRELLQEKLDGKTGLLALLRAAIDEGGHGTLQERVSRLLLRTNEFLANPRVRGCELAEDDASYVYLSLVMPFTVACFGEQVPRRATGCMAWLVRWWIEALPEVAREKYPEGLRARLLYTSSNSFWTLLHNGTEYFHDQLRSPGFQAVATEGSRPK